MTTTIRDENSVDHVIRLNVSWATYEALSADLGDESHVRLSYDGATLEIMSPGSKHERVVERLAMLVSAVRSEWKINIVGTGSTRFFRAVVDRGSEPDKSYYIAAVPNVRDFDDIDLAVDSPPDLVIEVDIRGNRTDKRDTYAKLGIPEFWRYSERRGLEPFALVGETNESITESRVIAGLPLNEIAGRLRIQKHDELAVEDEWREWLGAHRPPS
jgi:Uma2 family endonuclease